MNKVNMIVGFDQREAIAYHVFCQSVLEKTSAPVQFLPLCTQSLSGYEECHCDGSNAFIYTRFLSPWLMNYDGWVIFADGDMVCNDDIMKLWRLRDPSKAVQVVKHSYLTKAHRNSSESEALNVAMKKKNSGALMVRVVDKSGSVVYSS